MLTSQVVSSAITGLGAMHPESKAGARVKTGGPTEGSAGVARAVSEAPSESEEISSMHSQFSSSALVVTGVGAAASVISLDKAVVC